jgi:hypothetical protein
LATNPTREMAAIMFSDVVGYTARNPSPASRPMIAIVSLETGTPRDSTPAAAAGRSRFGHQFLGCDSTLPAQTDRYADAIPF